MRTHIDFQSISVIQTICQQYPSSEKKRQLSVIFGQFCSTAGFQQTAHQHDVEGIQDGHCCSYAKKTKAQSPGVAQSSADTLKKTSSGAGLLCLVGMSLVFFLEGANTQYTSIYSIHVQLFCKVQSQLSGLKPI